MKHYTEDELARYALDPGSTGNRVELELHLEGCAECRETAEFIRTVDGALEEPTPWEVLADLENAPPLPPSLLALAEEIQADQAHARELLAPLLDAPDRFGLAGVDREPRFETSGVVRVLADAAEAFRQKRPQHALALADAAIAIGGRLQAAGRLRSASYLGDALKERAIALATIGRFREAEQGATEAEAAYAADPYATELDLAIVQIVRANICIETDRLPEAETLAAAAATRFRAFGDTERYLNARVLQGNVLYARKDFRHAAAVYEELIPIARKSKLTVVLARALANAGESHACAGSYDAARRYFAESCALWRELGHEAERVRANWSLSNILLNTGDVHEAITGLESVSRDFDALGILNDAALARLQLAEALLVAERPREVPAVLAGVAMTFSAEGLTRNANIALAYLREAVASDRIEVKLIRDVRLYLEDLPSAPDRLFTLS